MASRANRGPEPSRMSRTRTGGISNVVSMFGPYDGARSNGHRPTVDSSGQTAV